MNRTEPCSKRKAVKALLRPGKRVRASGSETVPGDHSAAGPAKLLAPIETSNSDQCDDSRRSDGAVGCSSASGIGAPAQPSNTHTVEARRAKTAADIAWSAFKATLPVMEKVSIVFPPLQSAMGGLIKVLAHVDVRNNNCMRACQLSVS